jgi:N-acylneuraminate cytidylyltransferase
MNFLVIIPARSGSKGVPRKNIKKLGDKPLILYTVEETRKVFKDSQILVSTDSPEIKVVVENSGLKVPYLRPHALATDKAGTYEVLLHALDFVEKNGENPEILVLLQPTSPFRKSHHILEAVNLFNEELDMVVSVKETKANPYYTLREENEEGYLVKSKKANFSRRQDCPKVYELNGAIYVINVNSLKKSSLAEFSKVRKYVMDETSSHDIDTMMDWKIAQCLLNE